MTITPHSVEADARLRVHRACTAMPYAGSIGAPTPNLAMHQSEAKFANIVADWLEELVERLKVQAVTATANLEELDQLRRERAAIRSFLGTTQPTGSQ